MNKRLALISITGMVLLTLAGFATIPTGTGVNDNPNTNSTTNTSHINTPKNLTTSLSPVNAASSSPDTSLSTQKLSFQMRSKLLRQISDPGQGENCLNSSCSVSGTNFSGPSVTNPNVTLDMVYTKFKGWYIIVAPTTKNALIIAQRLIQKPLNFPYPEGVMLVYSKNSDYYWMFKGKENSKSEKLS